MEDSTPPQYISPYGSPSILLLPSLVLLLLALGASYSIPSGSYKKTSRPVGTASLASALFYKFLLWTVGVWYFIREQVWDRHLPLPPLARQEGRLVVITGGGRGIGHRAVLRLVSLGCRVVVGVRSPESVRAQFSDMREQVTVLGLDLLSMESVRSFAREVLELGPVHVLINNAGIMFGQRQETKEGFESQLCTNYLGHFLLTHLLLPALVRGGQGGRRARIVNVSSIAHIWGSWLDFEDMHLQGSYVPEQAYGNSKAAQVMFSCQLGRLLEQRGEQVVSFSLHPGVIYTDLYTNSPIKFISSVARTLMKTPSQGADSLVAAALDPALEASKGGVYLVNSRPCSSSAFTSSAANQETLWRATARMLEIPAEQFGQPLKAEKIPGLKETHGLKLRL